MTKRKPNTKQALVEAGKEALRIALIASLPVAIMQIQSGQLDLKQIGAVAVLAVLKAADKFVHESTLTTRTGIIPF